MTIKEIVEMEKMKENRSTILLFREGIFLKAYEQSAFLFYHYVRAYQVKNVFYKVINSSLISLGFPSNILDNFVSEFELFISNEQKDVYAINSEAMVFAEDKYLEFKEEYSKHEAIVRHKGQQKEMPHAAHEEIGAKLLNEKRVIDQIQKFNLASSTPMECMLFLNNLKKEMV